jgi:hypothetical protein
MADQVVRHIDGDQDYGHPPAPRTVGEELAAIAQDYCHIVDPGAMERWFAQKVLFDLHDARLVSKALQAAVECVVDPENPEKLDGAPELTAWEAPFFEWALRFFPAYQRAKNPALAAAIVATRARAFAAALAVGVKRLERYALAVARAPHSPRLGTGLRDAALDLPAAGRLPVSLGLIDGVSPSPRVPVTLEDFLTAEIKAHAMRQVRGDVDAFAAVVVKNAAHPCRVADAANVALTLAPVPVPVEFSLLQVAVWDGAVAFGTKKFTAGGLSRVKDRAVNFSNVIALGASFQVETCAEAAARAHMAPSWSPWADLPVRQRLARQAAEQRRRTASLYPV